MLLSEVLNKASPKIRTSNTSVSPIVPNKNHKILGIGGQAIAFLHKKFPGKLIKTIQIHGKDDPQYQFVRVCMNHQDNPYFPKIYGVKMYPTKEIDYSEFGEYEGDDIQGDGGDPPSPLDFTLYIATEKLNELDTIDQQDLDRMGIVLPSVNPILLNKWTFNVDKYKVASMIDYHFRHCFEQKSLRQQLMSGVKDPKLKQAFRLLEVLFNHYGADMHTGNIMLRGKQWVFVDPITYNS